MSARHNVVQMTLARLFAPCQARECGILKRYPGEFERGFMIARHIIQKFHLSSTNKDSSLTQAMLQH